jgi:hypothetical protein
MIILFIKQSRHIIGQFFATHICYFTLYLIFVHQIVSQKFINLQRLEWIDVNS